MPPSSDLSPEHNNPYALMEHYHNCIEMGDLSFDANQKLLILELQEVYNGLLAPTPAKNKKSKLDKLISRGFSFGKDKQQSINNSFVKGLYIWGGVGIGKTHMVDFFYDFLPFENKMRLHFHRFMQIVHQDLRKQSHIENPLKEVARLLAVKTRLLCLDEMHVNDITDAMILAQLFSHLFDFGVTLVTTSNVPPSGLYANGLQRAQFLPTIDLLEEKTKVVNINSTTDYRLRLLEQADVYQIIAEGDSESKETAYQKMDDYFASLVAVNLHKKRKSIIINNRDIPVVKWADGIAWFTFETLCESNRSTDDYIELGRFFHTIMISNVPVMTSRQNDAARRFVNMIDEFYDRHVNVIISAEAAPTELYIGTTMAFEFERTVSRLIEMQSKKYLHKEHGVD